MENNNELMVKGKIKVCGIEVPNIYGGFGGNKRIILAKTVAELHDMETRVINQDINRHITKGYFEEYIDYIDLKQVTGGDVFLDELKVQKIFTKAQIGNANNIYLLSEQGYTLLLKLLGSELAMKQYKQIVRDYFTIQTLTKEGLNQLVAREIGIIKRNKETEAMSILISRGELSHFKNPYACLTNTTYDFLYGMYAKDIKKYLDLKERDNLRDFLSTRDLEEIKEIEEEIVWMVKKNYTWRQIYDDLIKEYPNKIVPVRADKSIKELKRLDKVMVGDSGIKKLGK